MAINKWCVECADYGSAVPATQTINGERLCDICARVAKAQEQAAPPSTKAQHPDMALPTPITSEQAIANVEALQAKMSRDRVVRLESKQDEMRARLAAQRNGGPGRPLGATYKNEERARAKELLDQGMSITKTAAEVGLNKRTVMDVASPNPITWCAKCHKIRVKANSATGKCTPCQTGMSATHPKRLALEARDDASPITIARIWLTPSTLQTSPMDLKQEAPAQPNATTNTLESASLAAPALSIPQPEAQEEVLQDEPKSEANEPVVIIPDVPISCLDRWWANLQPSERGVVFGAWLRGQ